MPPKSPGITTPAAAGSELRSGFLEGLASSDRKAVLAAASVRRFVANSVLTHQETPADRLFLLTKGRARYFFITPEGRKVILFWLVPGDVFGGVALLSQPSDYPVSTETVKDSCVLMWERNAIRLLASRYPRLVENALSTASDYLVWYVATHAALTCHGARERLACVLVNLARSIGRERGRGKELVVTNEELAHAANLTEFSVSRLLSDWQRQGAIVKSRGKVLLRFPERLTSTSA
jgi:CRP-like cAMP-binding protein